MSKKSRGRKSLEYEIDSEGLDDMDETEASSKESTDADSGMSAEVINAERVYVRATPEKVDGNEIETLNKGDRFEILETVGEYRKVRLNDGRVGYIACEFCKVV